VGHIFWVRSVVFATQHGDAEATKVAEENNLHISRCIEASLAKKTGDHHLMIPG
jgi:hypothetical protein